MQNELYIVADAIKALRESRGLTQEQLAEKADISVSHLAKIETHARAMGMKTYIRLLEAMDIPIKEHFIHMGTAKKDMMLKEKIWYLVQYKVHSAFFYLLVDYRLYYNYKSFPW